MIPGIDALILKTRICRQATQWTNFLPTGDSVDSLGQAIHDYEDCIISFQFRKFANHPWRLPASICLV